MKKNILHMIGNAHIDPVWLWTWQEGFHEVKATFRSALDRMNETPTFTFCASSAAFYEWVEKSDPAMFMEIQRRVAEGRWQIVGGWWVEPDCNIPGGESFVRHSLYGQRYFMQKFNQTAVVGYNPDSFGHNASLPQILVKSGMPYYVFMRPMPHEMDLPGRFFWWESPDGSRVLAYRLPFIYCFAGNDIDQHILRCSAEMKETYDEGLCFYGVGDHGGGPTKEAIRVILSLQKNPDFPVLTPFSTLEAGFHSVAARSKLLPVVSTDLQHHASGCYAVHSGIKRMNRKAENRLQAAEKWSALAAWENHVPFPNELTLAWKNVLFNQFHDILAGTSLETAYEDARDSFGEALSIAGRALNAAVQSFAWRIHIEPMAGTWQSTGGLTLPGMKPIVAFNSLTWPVTSLVEMDFDTWDDRSSLIDEAGRSIPFQGADSPTTPWRRKLSFLAELPALGYRTFRLVPTNAQAAPSTMPGNFEENTPNPDIYNPSDLSLENDRLRLKIDPVSGAIASLTDKHQRTNIFDGLAALPVVYADPSDTWSHDVFRFDQKVGEFTASDIRLLESGPIKTVLSVTSQFGSSTLIQDFTLVAGLDAIQVHVVVNWQEQHKLLKLRFPVNVENGIVTQETAYGFIENKADGEEEPYQGWVDVTGTTPGSQAPYGFSLLNDGKYSLDVQGADIGMTILRSPAYAHHFPSQLQPGGRYRYIDQGMQEFTYWMLPHLGGWEVAQTVKHAAVLNQPPFAMLATYHPDGALPLSDSFISVDSDNILVSVIKRAEDNEDLILRAYETAHLPTRTVIHLPHWDRQIQVEFSPGEIKTFRIPADAFAPVVEVDLLERPVELTR